MRRAAGTCSLVIKDAAIKQTVGAYYKRAWDEQVAPQYRAPDPIRGINRERFLRLLEHAQEMAAHESPRTTKLYDRTKERHTQDEVERIRL